VLAGCGSGAISRSGTSSTGASPRARFGPCERVTQPKPKNVTVAKPTAVLPKARTYIVDLATTCAKIAIRLDTARAPKTAASFAGLVRRGFYDDLTFHRISNPGGRPFVIRGGDPRGDGTGGPGSMVAERTTRTA
jgi:peptidyl-prolyl cis-trans isomerase B (cyclophilin B)